MSWSNQNQFNKPSHPGLLQMNHAREELYLRNPAPRTDYSVCSESLALAAVRCSSAGLGLRRLCDPVPHEPLSKASVP